MSLFCTNVAWFKSIVNEIPLANILFYIYWHICYKVKTPLVYVFVIGNSPDQYFPFIYIYCHICYKVRIPLVLIYVVGNRFVHWSSTYKYPRYLCLFVEMNSHPTLGVLQDFIMIIDLKFRCVIQKITLPLSQNFVARKIH